MAIDWKGLNPAPVTLFKDNGDVDYDANAKLAKWLASIDGVKSLVILGHAGEGTFLTHDEQLELIRVYKDATPLPVVAGITGEGTRVAEEEAKEKYDAGASAALVYPNHGWLRFGYQKGAPQTRYQAIAQSGLECILFQYPAATKANYDLDTQLEICAIEGVTATKNGVRDMKRWYNEIPAIKNAFPDIAGDVLPRRMAAADDVRHRRPAGRLRQHGAGASHRATSRPARRRTTRSPASTTSSFCRSPAPSTTAARTWKAGGAKHALRPAGSSTTSTSASR